MKAGDGASPLVLGRYDERDVFAMFDEEGVIAAIGKRGFDALVFEIDPMQGPLTHVRLSGNKNGSRYLLLDACLTETALDGAPIGVGDGSIDLLVVYWLREQDPTATFDARHLRLPLQEHPGLGVLRSAFRVAVRIARQIGKHGIAALPKFFHDAAIFYCSRLFLFLDPAEQGRFEALLRDLAALSLQDASLALAGSAVRDASGRHVSWKPGYQVMPLAPPLTDLFHEPGYQAACRLAFEQSRYVVDDAALDAARRVFERSVRSGPSS